MGGLRFLFTLIVAVAVALLSGYALSYATSLTVYLETYHHESFSQIAMNSVWTIFQC